MNVIKVKELCLKCLHLFSKPLFLVFQAHAVTKDVIVSAVRCDQSFSVVQKGMKTMWSHDIMNISLCVSVLKVGTWQRRRWRTGTGQNC